MRTVAQRARRKLSSYALSFSILMPFPAEESISPNKNIKIHMYTCTEIEQERVEEGPEERGEEGPKGREEEGPEEGPEGRGEERGEERAEKTEME